MIIVSFLYLFGSKSLKISKNYPITIENETKYTYLLALALVFVHFKKTLLIISDTQYKKEVAI